MSSAVTSYGWEWEALLRTWQELDVPEGWRAEITEGGVTMTPPPGNGHNKIANKAHRARTDRVEKLWAYAKAPVPLYLLIEHYREPKPSVTLFTDPVDGHYRRSEQVAFGEQIRLPAPFGLVLDTAAF
ncbi:Uma2 family endonuclease [Amycolatopsis granulosa]|uniref:Uma2 family endonuclease n=1 Tax=Amycolatopsis granulosa TaxID=185684 RepID=UPI0014224D77|nr:Uma2 family endonuclease [Amycolatopsis granulosa]NIH86888.1 hypothetical protein [Amycolatopsis granulosa]